MAQPRRVGIGVPSQSLGWIVMLVMLMGLYGAFIYAPTEKVMGNVQRVFYIHVPSAWVTYLAVGVAFVASILFLRSRNRRWDTLAQCSVEIGTVFATIVLITGPIWGKSAWGTWWTWDARLTSMLVLWLILIAYQMMRSYVQDPDQRARYSAVLAIVGALDIPIIHFSVTWWRTLHPEATVIRAEGPTLDPRMLQVLIICLVAFTLLYILLLIRRFRLEEMRDRVAQLKVGLGFEDIRGSYLVPQEAEPKLAVGSPPEVRLAEDSGTKQGT